MNHIKSVEFWICHFLFSILTFLQLLVLPFPLFPPALSIYHNVCIFRRMFFLSLSLLCLCFCFVLLVWWWTRPIPIRSISICEHRQFGWDVVDMQTYLCTFSAAFDMNIYVGMILPFTKYNFSCGKNVNLSLWWLSFCHIPKSWIPFIFCHIILHRMIASMGFMWWCGMRCASLSIENIEYASV